LREGRGKKEQAGGAGGAGGEKNYPNRAYPNCIEGRGGHIFKGNLISRKVVIRSIFIKIFILY